jgi:hypothetical protein
MVLVLVLDPLRALLKFAAGAGAKGWRVGAKATVSRN